MYLPQELCEILSEFKENNIEAYVVGGSVRDGIMGKKPDDFDITTVATPQVVMELFKKEKVIATGIKHGTVTVIKNGFSVEITTYRVESGYTDFRHPDSVVFSKELKDDLSRRDFTVNAICYHPEFGYYDPFDGIGDIKRKLLKTVGNAEKRFSEDALRILRAVRFSSVLGFDIERNTQKAIFSCKHLLCNVSKERIFVEFKKLLLGHSVGKVLNTYFPVLQSAIATFSDCALVDKNFSYIDMVKKNIPLLLAALFLGLEKEENVENLAERTLNILKSDKKTRSNVCLIINEYNRKPPTNKYELKKLVGRVGAQNAENISELWVVFKKCHISEFNEMNAEIKKIISDGECIRISQLKIDGDELLKSGVAPKNIGKTLEVLLDNVMRGSCDNEKSALLEYVKEV